MKSLKSIVLKALSNFKFSDSIAPSFSIKCISHQWIDIHWNINQIELDKQKETNSIKPGIYHQNPNSVGCFQFRDYPDTNFPHFSLPSTPEEKSLVPGLVTPQPYKGLGRPKTWLGSLRSSSKNQENYYALKKYLGPQKERWGKKLTSTLILCGMVIVMPHDMCGSGGN